MSRGVSLFFTRLFTNKHKDLFITRLGVNLILAKFKINGPLAKILDLFLRYAVGFLIEEGVFIIDLAVDSYKEGMKLEEFEEEAKKAYEKATKRAYSEDEKNEIRKEYLKIISSIGNIGNPK